MKRDSAAPKKSRWKPRRAGVFVLLVLLVACGSRTGLFGPEGSTGVPIDGGRDAGGLDASIRDAGEDALPPIDANMRDADRTDCPDAEATLVYLISNSYELYSFDPATGGTKQIGKIACPASPTATPFSMAVDRKGVAYIHFADRDNSVDDGKIFRVSTATAACVGTSFKPNQQGFLRFGMGFATNDIGPTETLFVAGSAQDNGAEGLARVDVSTFALTRVGNFVPLIRNAELTGTGDGRLFAFYTKNLNNNPPSFIGEIDTTSGRVVAETGFDNVSLGGGWAFAFWGGDFYMFTAPDGAGSASVVTRYRPADKTVAQVATLPTTIVGAGVSTCAPQ